jgi:hypothetical protein
MQALAVAGGAFDVVQLLLSAADCVSDVLVAVQFHERGQTVFFALCITIFCIASVANALAFAAQINLYNEPYWKVAVIMVPLCLIGLLLPMANYVLVLLGWHSPDGISLPIEPVAWGDVRDAVVGSPLSAPAREENGDVPASGASGDPPPTAVGSRARGGRATVELFVGVVASQSAALSMLDTAVTQRILMYLCMNVQALTESIPMPSFS